MRGGKKMTGVLSMEEKDIRVIRSILRSMINQHWSVEQALDEYDVPDYLRDEYVAQIERCFID